MAISIPRVETGDRILNQIQANVATALVPLLKNQQAQGTILSRVALAAGANSVAHGLGAPLTGWTVIRQRASATIYDAQDSNNTPQTTLALVASAAVVVDLYVF